MLGKWSYILINSRIIQLDIYNRTLSTLFIFGKEERQAIRIKVIHPFKCRSRADRPGQRTHLDLQFGFNLIEQIKWIFTWTVEFVDEDHHRRFTHATHLHQFTGLGLDTFGTVNHDNHTIDSCQGTVRIFGKIFVTGSVENIDLAIFVLETHHRSGYRNSTLTLNLHEVGSGPFLDLVRFDSPRHMNRTSKKQQLFSQSGFTGIRVTNDGERPSPSNLLL